MPQQRLVAVRKWRLGTTTRGHPSAIVADVLRTLQAHRIAWKKVGPYTYKCRKVLQLSSAPLKAFQRSAERPHPCSCIALD